MTIKAPQHASKIHRELYDFMHKFSINRALAAELMDCSTDAVSRIRSGATFPREKLIKLKRNFIAYMKKELDNIKL